ncbi:MAG: APC family permease [Dehalococcoidia bacterium]|nr:APC family permease [Dehalococcoidia bacterium]
MKDGDNPDASSERGTPPSTPFHPELIWHEEVSGRRPGDRMVRIAKHRSFQEVRPGVIQARPKAVEPQEGLARAWWRTKRLLIGAPIPTAREAQERFGRVKGLAILSSDALSSVAYGSEAIMRTLILAGVAALSLTLPISLVIVALLAIVATSYRQTVRAYPSGGGSYIVARENLGTIPGLTAGAALLVDYVLTVAVSIAAGGAALMSAFPALRAYDVEFTLGAVALISLINLRGVREAGTIFALPTYVFVASILGMIALGLVRLSSGDISYQPGPAGPLAGTENLGWFLLISAFAKGCTAMTGTEAISNAVPAFKPPESQNARATLVSMALLLGTMFLGISFLATHIGLVPDPTEHETVLSQLAHLIVGDSWYYYLVQFATAIILFLAANTSYSGFPWLLSIMARDRFAPRWFNLRGDRLAFTFGILTLGFLAGVILLALGSSVEKLLPLYAIGVFTSFTLSQTGMVVHWMRTREPNWRRSAMVNGTGAVATAIVTLIIAYTKFPEGAWMVVIFVPVLVALFLLINRHYRSVAAQLKATAPVKPTGSSPLVVVPVSSLSVVARQGLAFAQDLSKRVVAVHVAADLAEADSLRAQWEQVVGNVPLVVIESPYRMLLEPLLAYVDALRKMEPNSQILVLLPEFMPKHWWQNFLHNHTALRLKASLLSRPEVAVASLPYQLED